MMNKVDDSGVFDIDLLSENEDIARKQVGRVKNQEFKVDIVSTIYMNGQTLSCKPITNY